MFDFCDLKDALRVDFDLICFEMFCCYNILNNNMLRICVLVCYIIERERERKREIVIYIYKDEDVSNDSITIKHLHSLSLIRESRDVSTTRKHLRDYYSYNFNHLAIKQENRIKRITVISFPHLSLR